MNACPLLGRASYYFPGDCWTCGEHGHSSRYCPKKGKGKGKGKGLNELGEERQEDGTQDSLGMDLGGSLDKEEFTGVPLDTLDQWTTVSRWNRDDRDIVGVEVTVDSGAVDTVGPPSVAPGIPVRETKASRSGMHYRAANNMKIPNLGEKKLQERTEEGQYVGMTIHVAQVNKVLASVRENVRSRKQSGIR